MAAASIQEGVFPLLHTVRPEHRPLCQKLQEWCLEHQIPEDHGYDHYLAVYSNARKALKMEAKLEKISRQSILLAALLHDVDDRKLSSLAPFPSSPSTEVEPKYPWAAHFLTTLPASTYDRELVLEMIGLVSCSTNGSTSLPEEERWKLIPRDADRQEALGLIGIRRCLEYGRRTGAPFLTPSTPLATTEKELRVILEARPLEQYVARGGTSESSLDHFYDKLLHLGTAASGNSWLQEVIRNELDLMIDQVLTWGEIFAQLEIMAPLRYKPLV